MSEGRAIDDQGLPWLEGVDDEEGPRAVSGSKMFAALLIVGLAALLVAGTFFWLGQQATEVAGAPELIRADPQPYKSRPDDPGGLDVAGDSETAYSTSAGEDPDAALDMNKLPSGVEAPPPEPAPTAKPEPKAVEPPKAPPAAAAAADGPTIQLGAYASTIKAETAWSMLSARFPEVAALDRSVVSASVGGKSVHRLRAVGSEQQTRAACAALKAAGESCLVVK